MLASDKLITTLKNKCKVCYTCVRVCPAKAIQIIDGQATVISSRCIGCGRCVKVCSQEAKQVYNSIPEVKELLKTPVRKAAIIAPSFPAEFTDRDVGTLISQIRQLGFDLVCEVAAGADLVALQYKKLLEDNPEKHYIATTCPAIVNYVEKYHPDLTDYLAPIASPMTATARALHEIYPDIDKIVFIGPCLAKKTEAILQKNTQVDSVLTFAELREMLNKSTTAQLPNKDTFDPPNAELGILFPISRGLLQAAGIEEDLLSGQVVAVEGRADFIMAIQEFEKGTLDAQLLEALSCEGCIMGAGMATNKQKYHRRSDISNYSKSHIQYQKIDNTQLPINWADEHLTSSFISSDSRVEIPPEDDIRKILTHMGKHSELDELNCRACGYETCREHAIAILRGLAESEMCLPYTINALHTSLQELTNSNNKLADIQTALHNAEKLASMGQLSAGIAHEINNPLGVIMLYANSLLEELDSGSENFNDVKIITEHTDRVRKIASGLLDFARKSEVDLKTINLNTLIEDCISATTIPSRINLIFSQSITDALCEIDANQFIQVINNLIKNAIEAIPNKGTINITTEVKGSSHIILIIQDTGTGIHREDLSKIFEPFFTTKKMGEGTGLGLAVTYGIIKMHSGQIDVVSNVDSATGPTGSKFTITIPIRGNSLKKINA